MDSAIKWFLIVCTLLIVLYKYGTRNYDYWKKKGVKQLRPIPFFGTDLFGLIKRKHVFEIVEENYRPFKKERTEKTPIHEKCKEELTESICKNFCIRFVGVYIGQVPFLMVKDPDLLKQIMVKDAEFFLNRPEWFRNTDPLMRRTLGNLADENWKKVRTVMSTVFTSAKMKDMYGFMEKCAKQSMEYLEEKVSDHRKSHPTDKTGYEIEWKEFFSRYGTDVIGSTAYGFEVDSFKNPENEFYRSGLVIGNLFKGIQIFRMFFIMTCPKIAEMLGLTFFGEKYNKFFVSLIEDTIREREEKNIVRKDVIHILMEARKGKAVNEEGESIKGKLPELTDIDIAAQAIVFFFGGYETIATLLGFMAYELALNPDVQERLQQEIDEVFEKENGFTYDGIMHQMQYLKMVVNETLRKWPAGVVTDRAVTKTYTIPKTDVSPEVVLEKGSSILVSIPGLHHDPEFFPNPQKFDPERFRDEKNTIKPFSYLPFGEGQRHCIGMRYALMEAKTIMVHLLKKFTFVPGRKTTIPIKLVKKGAFVLTPEDGFWLAVQTRQ